VYEKWLEQCTAKSGGNMNLIIIFLCTHPSRHVCMSREKSEAKSINCDSPKNKYTQATPKRDEGKVRNISFWCPKSTLSPESLPTRTIETRAEECPRVHTMPKLLNYQGTLLTLSSRRLLSFPLSSVRRFCGGTNWKFSALSARIHTNTHSRRINKQT
jgi:hypothetical protein